jgi:hypothetical protein
MPFRIPSLISAVALALLGGCSNQSTTGPTASVPVAEQPGTTASTQQAAVVYKERTEGRYRESRFMRAPDMFISADSPQTVSAEEATFLDDDDEVLGFVIDGEARAYSVRMLCYHHVVNDQIGETPIAVTY